MYCTQFVGCFIWKQNWLLQIFMKFLEVESLESKNNNLLDFGVICILV